MGKAINYVRGSVRLEITGPYPERFLNLCGAHNVRFWGMEKVDETTLRLTVSLAQVKRAEKLCPKCLCEAKRLSQQGAPSFLRKLSGRYGMVLGMALSLLAVFFLSRFVLVIEVKGNDQIPEEAILNELEDCGLRPGVYGPEVDERRISNEMLLRMEQLGFLSVNVHGVRAEVLVREAKLPPEVEPVGVARDLVAGKAGQVLVVLPRSGSSQVKTGDLVEPGQVLLSGQVPVEKNRELPPEKTFPVVAKGEVWAEVTEVCTASVPLVWCGKNYTGKTKAEYEIQLWGKGCKISPKAFHPFTHYDKIEKTWSISIGEGAALPLTLVRRVGREYQPAKVRISPASAQAYLERLLTRQLREKLGAGGAVLHTNWERQEKDGVLTLILTANCREQIAVPADIS